MAQFIDFIVDRRILLDVRIARRDIRFWLIEIVIGYKVFYRIIWEETFKLAAQLSSQCFIMGDNQGRFLNCLNHLCHSKGFTCTSSP